MGTANVNLRRHLIKNHPDEYDKAIVDNQWQYRLSTDTGDASVRNNHKVAVRKAPPFSPAAFLEHLVRFIVADDQVCPGLLFFHALTRLQVYSCCRVPRVSTIMYGTPGIA